MSEILDFYYTTRESKRINLGNGVIKGSDDPHSLFVASTFSQASISRTIGWVSSSDIPAINQLTQCADSLDEGFLRNWRGSFVFVTILGDGSTFRVFSKSSIERINPTVTALHANRVTSLLLPNDGNFNTQVVASINSSPVTTALLTLNGTPVSNIPLPGEINRQELLNHMGNYTSCGYGLLELKNSTEFRAKMHRGFTPAVTQVRSDAEPDEEEKPVISNKTIGKINNQQPIPQPSRPKRVAEQIRYTNNDERDARDLRNIQKAFICTLIAAGLATGGYALWDGNHENPGEVNPQSQHILSSCVITTDDGSGAASRTSVGAVEDGTPGISDGTKVQVLTEKTPANADPKVPFVIEVVNPTTGKKYWINEAVCR